MNKILLIGSGAREHAIARALKADQEHQIIVSPGNAGIALDFPCISLKAFQDIVDYAKENEIDYVFVGNEQPLAEGLADVLSMNQIPVIGPSQKAALIESSKVFSKNLMKKYNIPTAEYQVFEQYDACLEYLKTANYPQVLKADGLAAGKGVLIVFDYQSAEDALKLLMLDKKFGDAGNQVIAEEFLVGEEASVFAFCDGEHFISTIFAQDHKAVYDDDKGPNTGGMGAFAPVDKFAHLKEKVDQLVFQPILDGMKNEGYPFVGVLFAGLMIHQDKINVIEFNCRLGDPETEVILPLLDCRFNDLCLAILQKRVHEFDLKWKKQYAVTVVCASEGYPESFDKGNPISIDPEIKEYSGCIYYAGVSQNPQINEGLVNSGGRVLCATALEDNLKKSIDTAYQMVKCIHFDNKYHRTDIGKKGLS